MDGEFQRILREHLLRYPAMEPQDCGKLAFQSEFGPEHLAPDRARFLAMLEEEWQPLFADGRVSWEDIGGGLCRLHLGGPCSRAGAELLSEMFLRTAAVHTGTRSALEEKLRLLAGTGLPGMESWLAEYRSRGCPAVHHSAAFREAYRPHYRVILKKYGQFFPALLAVWELTRKQKAAVVAVDGRCGSGKTTLARTMESLMNCRVFHMDDFYLPPADRAPDWREQPAGNMDLRRFRREVLEPVCQGRDVVFRPYDCASGQLADPVKMPARPLTVIEGSYSHHPELSGAYDLRIFLTCGGEEQTRRLMERERDYFPMFRDCWIPMEERYFRRFSVESGSDFTMDTGLNG